MDLRPLPFSSTLREYQEQAAGLLQAYRDGDPEALRQIHHHHPRFLDAEIPWLPRDLADSDIQAAGLELADAELTLARCYDFRDWPALTQFVEAVGDGNSPVFRFEAAVEAVIHGELATLREALRAHPELVRARSTRVTHFDPPVHGATLLHYVAANGVEGFRQITPPNAVEIAKALLQAGAEADALASMYGGQCTTMSMLVSSCHPANAGLQVALVDTLVDFGASVEPEGSGNWQSPLVTALAFGYGAAAEALVRRGARVDHVDVAAGLGRLDRTRELLPGSTGAERHRAITLAAQLGHAEVVRLLLDAGEDPNRYNPEGTHSHSTPLHQAALAGHEEVVRVLVERGARLDIKDTIYQGTPLGWANHGGQTAIADYLRSKE